MQFSFRHRGRLAQVEKRPPTANWRLFRLYGLSFPRRKNDKMYKMYHFENNRHIIGFFMTAYKKLHFKACFIPLSREFNDRVEFSL